MQIFDFWKSETYVHIAEESTKKRFDKKYDKGPKFGSKQTSQSIITLVGGSLRAFKDLM